MAGVDSRTGKRLEGFAHVEQSLGKIFSTPQGSRVMREWLGNPGLVLLGRENATEKTLLLWCTIQWMLVELFEPRFRVTQFVLNDLDRRGWPDFTIYGEYRPYAHLDWEQAALFVSVQDGAVTVRPGA